MSALGPDAIRATRRPGVILAIAGCRLVFGLCLAYPLASFVAASGIGQRAEGDRLLFEGGSYFLLEIARLHGAALAGVARGLLPLLALGLLLTTLCNGLLLTALSDGEETSGRRLLVQAIARLPTLVLIGVLAALAQAALLLLGSIAAELIPDPPTKPVLATVGHVAVWLVAATLAGALGGAADLAKAASARAEAGIAVALDRARRCVLGRPFSACFGWLPYAAGFVLLTLAAAELTEQLDVSRPGAWRVLCVFLVHQMVVVASVALRAGWFAKALRLVSTAPS